MDFIKILLNIYIIYFKNKVILNYKMNILFYYY